MQTWAAIASRARRKGGEVLVRKGAVPHPRRSRGFVRSIGLPTGQIADWRKTLPGGECLHVHEHRTFYAVHVDLFDPHESPVSHLIGDVL